MVFSKTSIGSLFKKYRFNLVKTKPMLFDSFYVSILSEEYKSGEKKLWKGFAIPMEPGPVLINRAQPG